MMKKFLIVMWLVLFTAHVSAAEWYENGNLHGKNALAWQEATYTNKLATSGDLIAMLYQHDKLSPDLAGKIHNVDDIKILAEKLVSQLNDAFEPAPSPEQNRKMYTNQEIGETAALLMISMGWVDI